jgi:hypothetical protein
MSFLRNLAKVVSGSLFSFFLASLIIIASFAKLTQYPVLKQVFSEIFSTQLIDESKLVEAYEGVEIFCRNREEISLPLNNESIQLNCSEVRETKKEDFPELIKAKLFDKFYFKEYPCKFIECLQSDKPENLLIVFSKRGNEFFKMMQNYFLFATFGFGFVFVLSLETISEKIKGVGKTLSLAGFPYFILKFGSNLLFPPQLQQVRIKGIIERILNPITNYFFYIFLIGIALTVIGYLMTYLEKKRK